MKHTLRKYLSCRGSALFMVISTMAALMLLVTAMYMSVVSSRRVQLTNFNQEQAYVSATSLNEALSAYMLDKSNTDAIVGKAFDLSVGESVSTDGNNFKSFSPSGTEEDGVFGAYDVTITRLNDETMKVGGETKGAMVFDIAVTVMNNGVIETSHTYVMCTEPDPPQSPVINRFFTGTGYVPNDIYVSSFMSDSDLYFDNEYVVFGNHANSEGGDGSLTFTENVICAGTVYLRTNPIWSPNDVCTWVIGNDFLVDSVYNQGVAKLGGTADEHAVFFVGGDMILNGQFKFDQYTDVFVAGDIYVGTWGDFKGNLYCLGNIVINDGYNSSFGNVYHNGTISGTVNGISDRGAVTAEMQDQMLNIKTTYIQYTAAYPKWDVDIPLELDTTNITFNTDDTTMLADAKYIHYIDLSGGKTAKIGEVKDLFEGSGTSVNLTILIDTGDDPKGFSYLSLEPNCDDIGVSNTFMWYPESSPSGGKTITVLTVGCGTLVVDVPEGVTYQSSDQEFFGHISWYFMAGGSINKTSNGAPYFTHVNPVTFGDTLLGSDLVYKADNEECEYMAASAPPEINGSSGAGTTEFVECMTHGGVYKKSNADAYIESLDDEFSTVECPCLGRIIASEVEAYFSSNNLWSKLQGFHDDYYTVFYNGSAAPFDHSDYYPNVNIYIVSVLENADIQMGIKKHDGSIVQNNVFFGYVYAPYMTFISRGSGGGLKSVGGLIVSDIALNGSYKYLFVQPDYRIDYLFDADFKSLSPTSNRVWRYDGL